MKDIIFSFSDGGYSSVSIFFITLRFSIPVLWCVVIFYIYIPYYKYTLFSFKKVFIYKVFGNSEHCSFFYLTVVTHS